MKSMIHTPQNWKEGADYSDECYEGVYNALGAAGKGLAIFFIAIACLIALGLVIWQWDNILWLGRSLYAFVLSNLEAIKSGAYVILMIVIINIPGFCIGYERGKKSKTK